MPTTPFKITMMVANTVSRASASDPGPPADMIDTIRPISIAVTARANRNVPKGSPALWAITSA